MGQYDRHVFVCTSGDTCPTQGDTEKYVKLLRAGAQQAGVKYVRVNKAGCFSQCGHGPMIVVYPEDVWYCGVKEADLDEILHAHIIGGRPVERLRYDPGVPGPNQIDAAKKDAHAPEPVAAPTPAWKRVGAASDVPVGGMKEFAIDGTSVLVIKTGDGFFAYQALCPHEAVQLEAGVCDGSVLTCLEHMWQFDVRTGAPMGDAQEGLKRYPIKEERGGLYVALEG